VLYVDSEATERNAVQLFFNASSPRLHVSPQGPDGLEKFVRGESQFDAVVLGPNLEAKAMLDALRQLRTRDEDMPVVVVTNFSHSETTIAAFRLGAYDFLLRGPGVLTEVVLSLNNALRQADTQRLAARLGTELEELNRSLARQVADRTRDLEREVVVRREAELRAEEHAARCQALSTKLLRVQEDERRALAQELHDQVGQLLTGLRFQLEAAREAAPSEKLTEALEVSTELLRSVRELTLQLRPRLLDDLGLRPALEWQVKLYQSQTGIAVDLEVSLPEARLAPELETAVFRLVQEALTNVARHSGVKSAAVTVTADDAAVHAEVSDRGRGFDARAALARHDSLGLAGLIERVRLAGGQFELFSQPGQGTRLHAEFKLAHAPHSS
jgi:signal transduction histidine kinase